MAKDKISSRIARISGQVKGIERMYEEDRDCLEMVQQIRAVRSALIGLAKELLANEAVGCVDNEVQAEKIKNIIDKISKL
jgi:DNA-binding FrmR family transcriptional regulator